jgi:hypothetical protein
MSALLAPDVNRRNLKVEQLSIGYGLDATRAVEDSRIAQNLDGYAILVHCLVFHATRFEPV